MQNKWQAPGSGLYYIVLYSWQVYFRYKDINVLIHPHRHAHTRTEESYPLPFLWSVIFGWTFPFEQRPNPCLDCVLCTWHQKGLTVSRSFLYRNVDICAMWQHYSFLSLPLPIISDLLVINVSPSAFHNFHLSISGISYRIKCEKDLWFKHVNSVLTFDLQSTFQMQSYHGQGNV